MIPDKFVKASLTDSSMMLAEAGAATAFYTRAKNPETFDAWAAHIRENWIVQPGEIFGFLRPETENAETEA